MNIEEKSREQIRQALQDLQNQILSLSELSTTHTKAIKQLFDRVNALEEKEESEEMDALRRLLDSFDDRIAETEKLLATVVSEVRLLRRTTASLF